MGNYKSNQVEWQVGDLVLYDYDAKEPTMLLRVIKVFKNGKRRVQYCREAYGSKGACWNESLDLLHDPARFAVPTQARAIPHWHHNYFYRAEKEDESNPPNASSRER